MYGTTPEFLQYFGMKDLSGLPTLKEFQELEAGEDVMEEVPLEHAHEMPTDEGGNHTREVGAAVSLEETETE